MFPMTSLLCRFGADQVARVCEMLEESGDVERLARFLWSLPADAYVQAELDRHESVVRARALVAYHAGNFADLFHLLESFHFTQVQITETVHSYVCSISQIKLYIYTAPIKVRLLTGASYKYARSNKTVFNNRLNCSHEVSSFFKLNTIMIPS